MVQDYLTVYDGGAKDAPVLVRMCGGDAVPEIVSSGARMLLEFHTSPFDSPFHPAPLSYLPGFELEVQVRTAWHNRRPRGPAKGSQGTRGGRLMAPSPRSAPSTSLSSESNFKCPRHGVR